MLRFRKAYGATWELIFHHNMTKGETFNDSSALFNNETNAFSIIGLINDNFKSGGYFEYLLDFPEHNIYLRWKQKIHISNTNKNQNSADIGFKKIHVDDNGFKGLSRSTESGATVFDGSPGSKGYWYSVGAKCGFNNPYRFAGVLDVNTSKCSLWIRIPPRVIASCKYRASYFIVASLFINFIYS